MSYLKIENIVKSFGDREVLKSINIEVEKGSFITLLGHSGCGKSTLLRCIAGLEKFDNGSIYLEDERLDNIKSNKRNIGMIFQQYSLFPTKNVFENIAFGLKIKKQSKDEIKKTVSDILELVGLSGFEDRYPIQLSGGEQQRVALARSLVIKPRIMLYDEPLSAIDAQLRKELQQSIKDIHNKLNMTSIFVTHDQEEAMILSDIIYLMNNGVIEQYGTPYDLYHNPINHFVASFIGDHNIISKEDAKDKLGIIFNEDYLVISPENILINEESENNINIKGQVKDLISLGAYTKILIECDGLIIKANAYLDVIKNISLNDPITISIDKKKIKYVN